MIPERADTVMVSLTYDGRHYSTEIPVTYSIPGEYTHRFIVYRLGYVRNKFGFKFRWITFGRMAFSLAKIRHG